MCLLSFNNELVLGAQKLTGILYTCKIFLNVTKSYYNIYPTRYNVTQFILPGNCSTCFRWYHHPSSGAHTTVSTASGICQTVIATCHYGFPQTLLFIAQLASIT
jgi:hypothetical protein